MPKKSFDTEMGMLVEGEGRRVGQGGDWGGGHCNPAHDFVAGNLESFLNNCSND